MNNNINEVEIENKMVEITNEEREAFKEAIKKEVDKGCTLNDLIDAWEKGCKYREYFEGFKKLTIELWSEINNDNLDLETESSFYGLDGMVFE